MIILALYLCFFAHNFTNQSAIPYEMSHNNEVIRTEMLIGEFHLTIEKNKRRLSGAGK